MGGIFFLLTPIRSPAESCRIQNRLEPFQKLETLFDKSNLVIIFIALQTVSSSSTSLTSVNRGLYFINVPSLSKKTAFCFIRKFFLFTIPLFISLYPSNNLSGVPRSLTYSVERYPNNFPCDNISVNKKSFSKSNLSFSFTFLKASGEIQ